MLLFYNVHVISFSGALVNAAKIHETALHIAAREDYPAIAELLIEYGANVFASNNQNKLPIDLIPPESERIYHLLRHHSGTTDFYKYSQLVLLQTCFSL